MDLDAFYDKIYRRSHSPASLRFYKVGIRKLEKFVSERHGRDLEAGIKDLKSGKMDVYAFLDGYAAWMDSQGLKGRTQQDYMIAAKKLLGFLDIEVLDEKFREKVTTGRVEQIMDEAPTSDQARRILSYCNPRLKALIMTIASSGLRPSEALSLKVKNVDFDSRPVRLVIPARLTKGGASRESYVTDETAEAIKDCLGDRINDPEAYLFGFGPDFHMAEKKAIQMFRRVMAHFPEWDQRIDGHRVHKFHLYSFRKFFFTNIVGTIGETAAHALMGHRTYMDTYYKKPPEERRADYLKCMPNLTIFKPKTEDVELKTLKVLVESGQLDLSKSTVRKYLVEKLGIEDMEIKIAKMRQEGVEGGEAFARIISDELGIKPMRLEISKPKFEANLNSDPKKIVSEGELGRYLAEGWGIQTILPSGKIVVRKGG